MDPPAAPPPPEVDALLGQTLGGHYHVERVLGRGAMGVVYRVRHTLLEQDYALKVLHPELTEDPEVRRRFLLEARSLTAFTHKHAVQVRHCGEDHGQLFLVMDLVAGESLAARLAREGRLPSRAAGTILVQVLEALEEAHEAGIVHRDVKPANILVERVTHPGGRVDERARVVDFGLARWVGPHAEAQGSALASQGGRVVGTVAYMAPEQLRCEDVDGRADLFGVGAVLYEALTGERPFPGESLLSVAARVMVDPPRAWSRVDLEAVPAALRSVVERALEKDPARRYPSAGHMAEAVRAVFSGAPGVGGLPPPASPDVAASSSATTTVSLDPSGVRRARVPRAGLLLVLVAALAVGAWAWVGGLGSTGDGLPALLARGEDALARGRYEEARSAFAEAVQAAPDDGRGWLGRAEARTALRERGAVADFEEAERLLPVREHAALHIARARFRELVESDAPSALKELEAALWKDRGSPAVRAARADMALARGNLDMAREDLAALERLAPGEARTHVLRALLLLATIGVTAGAEALPTLEQARLAAEQAVTADPRWVGGPQVLAAALGASATVHRSLAADAEAQREALAALEARAEAIRRAEAHPGHRRQGQQIVRHYIELAGAAFAAGTPEAALAALDLAVALAPHDELALSQRAYALQQSGHHERAFADYEKLYDITQQSDALFRLGFGVQMLGDGEADRGEDEAARQHYLRAEAAYTRGLARFPDVVDLRTYRGEVRQKLARLTPTAPERAARRVEARADLEHVLTRYPADAETLLRRAELALAEERCADAWRDLRTALAVRNDATPRYHFRLAQAARLCAALDPLPAGIGSAPDLLAEAAQAAGRAVALAPTRHVPGVLLRGEVRLAQAALAGPGEERRLALERAQGDLALLREWSGATQEEDADDFAQAPRAQATAAYLRALIAEAEGEPVVALKALREAIAQREAERAAKRWALDARWYDLLARLCEQTGDVEGAAAARAKAAAMPR